MSLRSLRQLVRPLRRPPQRKIRRLHGETLETRLPLAASVTAPLADLAVAAGETSLTLDLFQHLNDPQTSGTVTRWTTSQGTFYVELFDHVTPITVQNFLAYVQSGAYNSDTEGDTFFHRSVPGFVLQGGGFRWDEGAGDDNEIDVLPFVPNEFDKLRDVLGANAAINVRGTLAMAKLGSPADGGPFGGGEDSASSQWFFNLSNNNASNLDHQNGGFTTFGRVLGGGMSVIDAIAALQRFNQPGPITGGAFSQLPLSGYTGGPVETDNLALTTEIAVVPELSFSIASNSNAALVTPSIVDGRLTLNHAAGATGSATITVRATDLNGGTVEDTFVVTYADGGNHAPQVELGTFNRTYEEAGTNRTVNVDLSEIFRDADLAGGDSLTYSVADNSNVRLVSTAITGDKLQFTVQAFQNGTATLTLRATDESGAFVEDSFQITVNAINNAPIVVNPLDDLVLTEDSGVKVIRTNELEAFNDLDLFTNGDSLTISVASNSNPQLVTTSMSGPYALLNLAPHATGTATLKIRATDSTGAWVEDEVTVTVVQVNDPPAFTAGSDITAIADGSPRTVAGWATAISAGPADEADQTLAFEIVGNTHADLFEVAPTVAGDGTLSYQLKAGAEGTATISVRLKDNGGTSSGGADLADAQTFEITSLPFNPWHNATNVYDVDGSSVVDQADLTLLLGELSNPTHSDPVTRDLPLPHPSGTTGPFLDIDGHLRQGVPRLSRAEVLQLVNHLRYEAYRNGTLTSPANESNPAQENGDAGAQGGTQSGFTISGSGMSASGGGSGSGLILWGFDADFKSLMPEPRFVTIDFDSGETVESAADQADEPESATPPQVSGELDALVDQLAESSEEEATEPVDAVFAELLWE